jgi:DNA repair exonuclease SbcCD ATPase subunit
MDVGAEAGQAATAAERGADATATAAAATEQAWRKLDARLRLLQEQTDKLNRQQADSTRLVGRVLEEIAPAVRNVHKELRRGLSRNTNNAERKRRYNNG